MANTKSTSLNGTSQFWSIADGTQSGLEPAGSFSIEAWIYTADISTKAYIFSKDAAGQRAHQMYIRSSICYYYINDTSVGSTTASLSADTWHHVAMTYDFKTNGTSVITMYLDGVQSGTPNTSAVGPLVSSTSAVQIGAREYSGYRDWFGGLIDEVRFWSDVRTAQEISDNYQKELDGDEANLVSYWKFNDDGTDSQTAGNNDLTNNNTATFSSDVPNWSTTSIKSINGLAYASVKSKNGLAIADIKSINGLA